MPQDVTCSIGGKEFNLPIEYASQVAIKFAPDLASCNVIIGGDNPDKLFSALLENNKCDGRSLWEDVNPKLNPKEAVDFGPMGEIPGQKIHSYTLDGKEYEVYYSPCSDAMVKIAKPAQLFFAILGPEEGAIMTSFEDSIRTHCYLTIEKNESTNCIIGWAAADEAYHYPDKTQLVISQLFILPGWQKRGHGSVLTACIWESTTLDTMPEISQVTWSKPSEVEAPEGQQQQVPEDPEKFSYALQLCRMLSKGIFTDFVESPIINLDAYQGDRNLTEWEKIRAAKKMSRERTCPSLQNLQWSRKAAVEAARSLQIPLPLLRMLFEINLLRTSRGRYAESIQHFIQRRLYNMEVVDLSRIDPDMVPPKMRLLYRETFNSWKAVTKSAQCLIEKKILPSA
eukprot:TRINITY_DN15462_c0_g1_i1.p1 TRINITY_DN15462_c0_g1~~TRINITY_DN15462_c0_g1_i1.p1  ORF type:complete len:413 (+),score=64.02 TRINITY_DN15462_c0_g1_i1:50-1240(+)